MLRGAVDRCVERLGYGAEGRLQVAAVEKLSVNQVVNMYLFLFRKGYGSERIGMGYAFDILSLRYSGPLPQLPLSYVYLAVGNLYPPSRTIRRRSPCQTRLY